MKRIVTAQQMREFEHAAMEGLGLPAIVLMERAALAVADVITHIENGDKPKRILILCGNGNNGADGFALARILVEHGHEVYAADAMDVQKRSKLNQLQHSIWMKLTETTKCAHVLAAPWEENGTQETACEYDVIVDAILGIGVNRPLSEKLIQIVDWMNAQRAYKVALDMPTGIDTDTGCLLGTAFLAYTTVTFGALKVGQLLAEGKRYCGQVIENTCAMVYKNAVSLKSGETQEPVMLDDTDLSAYLKRDPLGNKGTFGKIGIIAGNKEIVGAPILCVKGAFYSGAGYIKLLTHRENKQAIIDKYPETVLTLYEEQISKESVQDLFLFAKVIAIGPGIGTDDRAKELFEILLSCYEALEEEKRALKPLVMDADALNLISKNESLRKRLFSLGLAIVMTPHMLEFSRLSGCPIKELKENRLKIASDYAIENKVCLVLKDACTVIVSKEGKIGINPTGNDGMAVAGCGDVLCGVIASLIGQGLSPFEGAMVGTYLHGLAGDTAAKKLGKHSMLPSDLAEALMLVIKNIK